MVGLFMMVIAIYCIANMRLEHYGYMVAYVLHLLLHYRAIIRFCPAGGFACQIDKPDKMSMQEWIRCVIQPIIGGH
jgi:hypothetical protein